MLRTILLVVLVLFLLGGLPSAPWAANWGTGYYPSGTALVLIILVIIFL